MTEPNVIRYASPNNDRTEIVLQWTAENSPETPAASNNIAAPQTSGMAVRPMGSRGKRRRGDTHTPTAHEAAPTSTAIIPTVKELRDVSSGAVRIATPPSPINNPSPFFQLIRCCPMAAPSAKIHRGSLATRSAAKPEDTYCSAQCREPWPTRKKRAPRAEPAIQCSRRGRKPRDHAMANRINPATVWRMPADT